MSKVLVTGAAGFIGSHVARHCAEMGFNVVATDDLSGGFFENVPKNVVWVEGDLKSSEFVTSLWKHGPYEYVYHIAAYAAEGLSHFIRNYNYSTNLIASVNLINASILQNVKCFVFTSSIAVYGSNQVPMSEDLIPQPEDPYGISKLAVELDLKCAHEMFGLNYIIFRPHNVYGEMQNIADRYRNVVGIFMNQLLQGQPLTVFGNGKQTRAFSYIEDVAPVIAKSVINQPAYNEVFNIGADTPYSVLELAGEISKALKVEGKVNFLPARLEVVDAFSDHSKIKKFFDIPQPASLETGIQKMADWVLSIGTREPVTFKNIEVSLNMPTSWKS